MTIVEDRRAITGGEIEQADIAQRAPADRRSVAAVGARVGETPIGLGQGGLMTTGDGHYQIGVAGKLQMDHLDYFFVPKSRCG